MKYLILFFVLVSACNAAVYSLGEEIHLSSSEITIVNLDASYSPVPQDALKIDSMASDEGYWSFVAQLTIEGKTAWIPGNEDIWRTTSLIPSGKSSVVIRQSPNKGSHLPNLSQSINSVAVVPMGMNIPNDYKTWDIIPDDERGFDREWQIRANNSNQGLIGWAIQADSPVVPEPNAIILLLLSGCMITFRRNR